jgi:hypothetical protein
MKYTKKEIIQLIEEMHDPHDEKCRYDHHGYCQTHYLHEYPCPFSKAKDVIKFLKQENIKINTQGVCGFCGSVQCNGKCFK